MSTTTIEVKEAFQLEGKSIAKIEVNSIGFEKLTELAIRAASQVNADTTGAVATQRNRMIDQSVFLTEKGEKIKLTDLGLLTLPIKIARAIIAALPEGQGEPGKITLEGDGISTPIIYTLGTPIQLVGTKEGEEDKITELEFIAKTYGDLEKVMMEDHPAAQALAMIKMAKPTVGSLMSLPSWAISQISIADGVTILNTVVPRFLE